MERLERIFFSGGKIGVQIEIEPKELLKVLSYQIADICE
jgi:prolyl-tRNA editing enzyme YbaK/EbsC (Cys-tRNA(Pro) deacylase)